MVERQLPKLNVAGSIPVSRSIIFNILALDFLVPYSVYSACAPFAFAIAPSA